MESVALYSFQATESDELAFNKGDTLKVQKAGAGLSGPTGLVGLEPAPQRVLGVWAVRDRLRLAASTLFSFLI
jgi:hypothetical protein